MAALYSPQSLLGFQKTAKSLKTARNASSQKHHGINDVRSVVFRDLWQPQSIQWLSEKVKQILGSREALVLDAEIKLCTAELDLNLDFKLSTPKPANI